VCVTGGATGDDAPVSLLLVALLLPVGLLVLMLGMEHVERPLRVASVSDQLEQFLDQARPEEVETYVSQGFAPALDRYWRRRRIVPGRSR
jgi:hypothetical protein